MRAVWAAFVIAAVAAGCSDSTDPTAERTQFCSQLAVASSPAGALESLQLTSEASVAAALEQLTALREVAPGEVEADVAVIVETVDALLLALTEGADADPQEALEAMTDELELADEASERLADYASSQCGLDLRATPAPTPTPAPEAEEEFFD